VNENMYSIELPQNSVQRKVFLIALTIVRNNKGLIEHLNIMGLRNALCCINVKCNGMGL
jgi:hypothetical protein